MSQPRAMNPALVDTRQRFERLAKLGAIKLTNCKRCGGTQWGYFPHPDPEHAAAGRTTLQPCPVCNKAEQPCDVCGGQGEIRFDVPLSDPLFGRTRPCPANCEAVQEAYRERFARLKKYSGLPPEYEECTFAVFDSLVGHMRAGKNEARKVAGLFVDAWERDYMVEAGYVYSAWETPDYTEMRNWIVFFGDYGVGKTGMAASIVNALTAMGRASLYIRLQDAFEAIQKRYDRARQDAADEFGNASAEQVLDDFKHAPVLIVDELFGDPQSVTRDRREKLENIIRFRYGERLPTIFTTNFDYKQLASAWGDTIMTCVRARAYAVQMSGTPLRAGALVVPAGED